MRQLSIGLWSIKAVVAVAGSTKWSMEPKRARCPSRATLQTPAKLFCFSGQLFIGSFAAAFVRKRSKIVSSGQRHPAQCQQIRTQIASCQYEINYFQQHHSFSRRHGRQAEGMVRSGHTPNSVAIRYPGTITPNFNKSNMSTFLVWLPTNRVITSIIFISPIAWHAAKRFN